MESDETTGGVSIFLSENKSLLKPVYTLNQNIAGIVKKEKEEENGIRQPMVVLRLVS